MSFLEKSQKKSQNVPKMVHRKKTQKFSCEVCHYNTSNKSDFRKHISTSKHGTKWYMHFATFSDPNFPAFSCDLCDHFTCNKEDFEVHKMDHKKPQISEKSRKNKNGQNVCKFCGKSYKFPQGLYRHIKKCNANGLVNDITNNKLLNLVVETQNQLMESQEQTRELCNEIIKLKDTNKIINNNTYNQSVNINLFLNEECKNAMNLTDFLSKLQMTIADLAYTKNNGMIKGITNIVIKNLEDTPPTERPIHSIKDECGSQLYIKEHDMWECGNKKEKIEKTIDTISKKQCSLIKEWEEHYPDWNKTEGGQGEYMEICRIILGGTTESELEKTRDLILQRIPVTNVITNEGDEDN